MQWLVGWFGDEGKRGVVSAKSALSPCPHPSPKKVVHIHHNHRMYLVTMSHQLTSITMKTGLNMPQCWLKLPLSDEYTTIHKSLSSSD